MIRLDRSSLGHDSQMGDFNSFVSNAENTVSSFAVFVVVGHSSKSSDRQSQESWLVHEKDSSLSVESAVMYVCLSLTLSFASSSLGPIYTGSDRSIAVESLWIDNSWIL